jgi:hydroxymethylbilane synthase
MSAVITLGTRGSKLALAQANWVADRLREKESDLDVRVEIIKTKGDRITDRPLSQIGGKGLFTKELENALMDGTIDCAVHSLKDLPTELPEGLALAAVPEREDPRDTLITRDGIPLSDLPAGAVVGTSSLRRAAQLRSRRDDLEIVDLRGNINTRIQRVLDGDIDAAILAHAGIVRLALDVSAVPIDEADIVPAPAQGALGLEIRVGDTAIAERLARIQDQQAVIETTVERTCLAVLEGGCQVPLGIRATKHLHQVHIRARVCSLDGKTVVEADHRDSAKAPAAVGEAIGRDLLARGAAEIVAAAR